MAGRELSDAQLLTEASRREIPISDAGLLRQALTHKSLVPETPQASNERLEFLGDSILNQVIAEYLFHTFPERNEGELAKARSLIVCKSALAAASRRMTLAPLMRLGATEEALGGRARASLIADAYEALVAVISLTDGLEACRTFILRTLAPEIEGVRVSADWRDAKTILQELCQSDSRPLPIYQIVSETGKPHDRTFVADVLLGGEKMGSGTGKSKKEAEQAAAQAALTVMG